MPATCCGASRWLLMVAAVTLTLVTGVDYVVKALAVRRDGRSRTTAGQRPSWSPALPAPYGGLDLVRGADQGQVRERLREVADEPPALRVVLLGEQADVVGQLEQPLASARGRRRAGRRARRPRPARTSRPGTGARRRRARRPRTGCGSAAAARRASGPPRRPRWCRASAGRRPAMKPTSESTSSEASTSSVS